MIMMALRLYMKNMKNGDNKMEYLIKITKKTKVIVGGKNEKYCDVDCEHIVNDSYCHLFEKELRYTDNEGFKRIRCKKCVKATNKTKEEKIK